MDDILPVASYLISHIMVRMFVILLSIPFCIPGKFLVSLGPGVSARLMYHGERELWRAAGEKNQLSEKLIAMKEQCLRTADPISYRHQGPGITLCNAKGTVL